MPNKQTKQSASTVKEAKKPVKVIELVRRQGIYTGTLQTKDVEDIVSILDAFEREDGMVAKMGAKVVELEFTAKGGRKGTRGYCLRLPNIAIEDLKKIGFSKDNNFKNYYTAK